MAPTVNRLLHYIPHVNDQLGRDPLPAIVCAVKAADVVNVSICDSNGGWRGKTDVRIFADDAADKPQTGGYLVWPKRE